MEIRLKVGLIDEDFASQYMELFGYVFNMRSCGRSQAGKD